MSIESVISVSNVSKSFWVHARTDATLLSRMADMLPSGSKRLHSRSISAVQDVSFDVHEGEVLGIVGKNASGKTTLLRLIAGILEPDTGSVHVEGPITSLINLSVGLQYRLTIRDNIFLTCSLFGMSRQHIRDVFDVILEYAGITDADMYPYQLSVGMSQRLAFSIAVHTKPRILLLDEIFSAGDESFRKKAMYTMDELISSNVTVVMVSHNLERVEELSDRILWMDQGIVQHQGDPKETIAAYRQFCHCSTPNAKHHGSAYKHSSSPPASSSHL